VVVGLFELYYTYYTSLRYADCDDESGQTQPQADIFM